MPKRHFEKALFCNAKAGNEKSRQAKGFVCSAFMLLYRAGYLTRTHTTGAGVDVFGCSVDHRFDTLYVGLKGSVGTSVRMGNLNAELNALATNIAFRHLLHLLISEFSREQYDNRFLPIMQVFSLF
jgi:hypothetical protein